MPVLDSVGGQPFRADSQAELMEQVTSFEARPPRQYDENIPKELERICSRALGKRASERYSTASDLAEDLHDYLSHAARRAVARPLKDNVFHLAAAQMLDPLLP